MSTSSVGASSLSPTVPPTSATMFAYADLEMLPQRIETRWHRLSVSLKGRESLSSTWRHQASAARASLPKPGGRSSTTTAQSIPAPVDPAGPEMDDLRQRLEPCERAPDRGAALAGPLVGAAGITREMPDGDGLAPREALARFLEVVGDRDCIRNSRTTTGRK